MQSRAQPNPLGRDVQNVVSEAQELLKTVKDEGANQLDTARARVGEKYDAAREKLGEMQAQAREKFGEIQTQVSEGAKYAVTTTDQYVHTNPWQAVGIAAAAGAIIGFLLSRR